MAQNINLIIKLSQLEHSVEVDDVTRRVHGYASYWGVHVDHEYQPYITDDTEMGKEMIGGKTQVQQPKINII